jgi:hypothetical protein
MHDHGAPSEAPKPSPRPAIEPGLVHGALHLGVGLLTRAARAAERIAAIAVALTREPGPFATDRFGSPDDKPALPGVSAAITVKTASAPKLLAADARGEDGGAACRRQKAAIVVVDARILEQGALLAGVSGQVAALQPEPAVAFVAARAARGPRADRSADATVVVADKSAAALLARGAGAGISQVPADLLRGFWPLFLPPLLRLGFLEGA